MDALLIGRNGLRILNVMRGVPIIETHVIDRPPAYAPGMHLPPRGGRRVVEFHAVDRQTYLEVVNERTDWSV